MSSDIDEDWDEDDWEEDAEDVDISQYLVLSRSLKIVL